MNRSHCPAPNRSLPALLAGLALLCAFPATAQEETTENWYQVEVVIFARQQPDDAGEQWPRDIRLRYPLDWKVLDESPSDEQQTPTAFARLPSEERDLNRHAGAMSRSGDYRILYHEGWRQPIAEEEEAPSLLVRGGETFGKHHELEGSIHLSRSRYLHLRTRLWLTDFEPNYGQPPGAWPELPRWPEAPLPEPEPMGGDHEDDWARQWRQSDQTQTWDTRLNTTSSLPDFQDKDYVPERIVTMTQQRRMRSEELHYLDHPRMGLLIRVTPYEMPKEAQEENEETGGGAE